MFAPRGLVHGELGKFDVFANGRDLHLFSFPLPNHDVVLHAASDDGLSWRLLLNAFHCGDPGDADDDEIWSVGVVERDRQYSMLYTGLARAEDGLVQRTLLATSTDLLHWTKRGIVASADPRWYDVGPRPEGRVSWRDAKPIQIDGTFFALVCAHERDGPLLRRGCIGLLASQDGESWETRPPIHMPRLAWDLECPQLFQVDGSWYLTASISEDRTIRYWSAPKWCGPFEVPATGSRLGPASHYAGRVVRWRDMDLLISQVSAASERSGFPRRAGKFVSPPLVLRRRTDGSLACESYPGWRAYRQGQSQPLPIPELTTLHAQKADRWHVDAGGGLDLLVDPEPRGNFWLDATLILDAPTGGVVFRSDERGASVFIELACGATEVVLHEWMMGPARTADRPFKYVETQRARLSRPVERGRPILIQLLVVGQYVECSFDGEVALAAFLGERPVGRVGIWAEGGTVSARDLSLVAMEEPQNG